VFRNIPDHVAQFADQKNDGFHDATPFT